MCPVCTVTVIAGLGISRLLGIDDLITSIWIGGFILSFSFITVDWIEKARWRKKVHDVIGKIKLGMIEFTALNFWVILLMYALAIIPLFLDRTIGIAGNTLWGIDKIILGVIIGSVVFFVGILADKKARKSNGGGQFIKFQKVVFPVLALIITSAVFYFLVK